MEESLLAKLGLDISEFKSKAAQAGNDVKEIKKGFNDFKDLLAGGGIAAGAISIFKAIIDHAKNAKGEVDENTAAVQRYGEGLASIKEGALDFGVAVVGGLNRFGEAAGTFMKGAWASITGSRKEFEAAEAAVASTERSLRQVEASLAEAKKHASEFASINKQIADIDAKRAEAQRKSLTDQERLNALANELAEINARVADFEGSAIERKRLLLEQKKAEAALEAETAALAEKTRKEGLDRREQERKVAMERLDNAGKLKQLNAEIALTTHAIAIGALQGKNAEEATVTLKLRQKELSELTIKLNAEERKTQEDFRKKAQLNQEQQLELIMLEAKGVQNLVGAERARYDILKLIVAQQMISAELGLFAAKGWTNLTDNEKSRALHLIKQNEIITAQIAAKNQLIDGAAAHAAEEKNVTAEIVKQLENTYKLNEAWDRLIVSITRRGNPSNVQLTDRQLDEKISNLRRALSQAQIDDPFGQYGYLYNQQRTDLRNAETERGTRASFRNDVRTMGEEEALGRRSAFEEDRFRNYIRPEDEQRAVNQANAIQEIADRISGRRQIFGGQ